MLFRSIFPKGFPVGTAVSVQPGQGMKDVKLNLSGAPGGAEEVLVVLQGVHQPIPTAPVAEETATKALPPPPPESTDAEANSAKPQTEADKVLQKYDTIGKEQNHAFGAYGSAIPNFNLKPGAEAAQAAQTQAPPAATAGARIAPKTPETQASSNSGASGGSTPKAPAKAQNTSSGPVLPLGAPRHRSTGASPQPSLPPPQPPQ